MIIEYEKETPDIKNSEIEDAEVIEDDDFFKHFSEPKEPFDIPEPEKKEEPQAEKPKDSFFDNTEPAEIILSASDRKKAATHVFELLDNSFDWIGNMISGVNEVGRYKADSSHRGILIENIQDLLPKNFTGLPKWVTIVLVIGLAYGSAVSNIKSDRADKIAKENAENLRKATERAEKRKKEKAEQKEKEANKTETDE